MQLKRTRNKDELKKEIEKKRKELKKCVERAVSLGHIIDNMSRCL